MPNPDLTYYYGRRVVRVHIPKDKPSVHPSEWAIELEGGVIIKNKAKAKTAYPNRIEGTVLLNVDFQGSHTDLQFGQAYPATVDSPEGSISVIDEVVFNRNMYRISDRELGEGDFNPDDTTPEPTGLPPDPSADRVASGPQ